MAELRWLALEGGVELHSWAWAAAAELLSMAVEVQHCSGREEGEEEHLLLAEVEGEGAAHWSRGMAEGVAHLKKEVEVEVEVLYWWVLMGQAVMWQVAVAGQGEEEELLNSLGVAEVEALRVSVFLVLEVEEVLVHG